MKTKHIFYCIFCVLMFAACSGIDYEQQLERFEEMNRTDVPLCVDSVQPIVRHYDHWWHSSNHRMRAYYMLGCAYRDQGSAPRALENYQRAVSLADTTDSRCDLNVLMRVHSQMSLIFLQQRLPEQEEEELLKAERLAWQIRDTVSALTFESHLCSILYNKKNYNACIKQALLLRAKLLSYGYEDESKIIMVDCVKSYLALKDYSHAKKYLNQYETCSYFQTQPERIIGGLGALYIYKGQYYVGIEQFDSAEIYFKKTLPYKALGDNEIFAYRGLYKTYALIHNADSIIKYTQLYSEAKERSFDEAQAVATIQAQNLYDYSIEQQKAKEQAERASRLTRLLVIAVMLIVLLSVLYLYRNERRKREISELNRDLEISLNNLRETEEALEALKQEQDADHQLVADMQGDIDKYQLHIESLKSALQKRESSKTDRELSKSYIVKRFREARKGGANITPLTEEDWTKMVDSIEEIYPQFHHIVNARGTLQTKEYRLCLLTKAKFSPSDIDVLMGQKPSYSTTIAKRLCQKVFGFDGSAADFRHSISLI